MSDLPEYRNLIGGQLRAPESGRYLDVENPATGQIWARIPASDQSDVNAAAEAAAAAFPAWSAMTAAERGYFLARIGEVFAKHGEELATLETPGQRISHRQQSGSVRTRPAVPVEPGGRQHSGRGDRQERHPGAEHAGCHPARALRGGGRDRPVERADRDHVEQGGMCAGRR